MIADLQALAPNSIPLQFLISRRALAPVSSANATGASALRLITGQNLGFDRYLGFLAFGIALSAEITFGAIATSGCAKLATVKNDLEMKLVPSFGRKKLL